MNAPIRLAVYGIGLVLVFGAATGAGRVIGPDLAAAPTPPPAHAGDAHSGDTHAAAVGHLPGGLQIAQDGHRLQPLTAGLTAGVEQTFPFRVLGPDERPVTGYVPSHERDLHLILVRRDLTGFQHLHPTLAADGTWSVPVTVTEPGQYRMLADFRPAGRAEGLTLGADIPVAGDYRPRPLPDPAQTFQVDGYTVTFDGLLVPGVSSGLRLSVSRGGVPVTDLEPYLGAYGHLVALRDGDLAYLHVHPEDAPTAGPAVTFYAEVPTAGRYRLFLDFKHGGKVRTAEFTAIAETLTGAESAHDDDGHSHD